MSRKTYSDFKTPNDVLTASNLNTELKIAILDKWKADEHALQRATSEGLNGGVTSNLQTVQKALSLLRRPDAINSLKQNLEVTDLQPVANQVRGIFGTKQL